MNKKEKKRILREIADEFYPDFSTLSNEFHKCIMINGLLNLWNSRCYIDKPEGETAYFMFMHDDRWSPCKRSGHDHPVVSGMTPEDVLVNADEEGITREMDKGLFFPNLIDRLQQIIGKLGNLEDVWELESMGEQK